MDLPEIVAKLASTAVSRQARAAVPALVRLVPAITRARASAARLD